MSDYQITETDNEAKAKRIFWAIKSHTNLTFKYKNKEGRVSTLAVTPIRLVKDNTMLVCGSFGKQLFLDVDRINPVEGRSKFHVYQGPIHMPDPKDKQYDRTLSGLTRLTSYGPVGNSFMNAENLAEFKVGSTTMKIGVAVSVNLEFEVTGEDDNGNPITAKPVFREKPLPTYELGRVKTIMQNAETGKINFGGIWVGVDDLEKQFKDQQKAAIKDAHVRLSEKIAELMPLAKDIQTYPNQALAEEWVKTALNGGVLWDVDKQTKSWEEFKKQSEEKAGHQAASELVKIAKELVG